MTPAVASRPIRSLRLVLLLAWAGCAGANVQLNRGYDDSGDEDAAFEAQSPDGFVERLGEPDEWRNEGEGSDLRMIATWRCVEGRDRIVTWRQRDTEKGVRPWVVVSDISQEADCD